MRLHPTARENCLHAGGDKIPIATGLTDELLIRHKLLRRGGVIQRRFGFDVRLVSDPLMPINWRTLS
jgi:hypothetical protein